MKFLRVVTKLFHAIRVKFYLQATVVLTVALLVIGIGVSVGLGGAAGKALDSVSNAYNYVNKAENTKSDRASGRGDHSSVKKTEEVGSSLSAVGNLTLTAGHDISVRASDLYSDAKLALKAENDVSIVEGRATSPVDSSGLYEKSGFLSKDKVTISDKRTTDEAIGSVVSGNTVTIDAGNDVLVRGSTVAASEGLSLEAGNDITIAGAENHVAQDSERHSEHSGFSFTSGGGRIGISYDKAKEDKQTSSREQTITSSIVGSETGNVTLYAGKDVGISGSHVVAGTGDVLISGENVDINHQYDIYDSSERNSYENTSIGISVGLGGAAGKAPESASNAYNYVNKAENAKSDRASALYDIAAAREAYDTVKNVHDVGVIAKDINPKTAVLGDGVSVRIGVSTTKSEESYASHDEVAVGSLVSAGGDAVIVARGKDDGNSSVIDGTGDLAITGSQVEAGGDVVLAANHDLTLKSAEEHSSYERSESSSSSDILISLKVLVGFEVKILKK